MTAIANITSFRDTAMVVKSGDTASNICDLTGGSYGGPYNLTIIAPATLTASAKLNVADGPSGTFAVLQDPPGTDFTIAAGKAVIARGLTARAFKLVSGGAEGADRTFVILGSAVGRS